VAEILDLKLEQPDRPQVEVKDTWAPGEVSEVLARLDRIEKLLREKPAS
jgi:hypothetical protein